MSFRTGNFPVMADGCNVGKVNVAYSGLMLVFNCTCDYRSPDILRLAAVCGGAYVPLGIMAPEAGVLRLKKSFSKNSLTSIGYHETVLYHLIKPGDVYTGDEDAESAAATQLGETSQAESEPVVHKTAPEAVLPVQVPEPIVYNDFPDPEEYFFEPEADENASEPEPPVTTNYRSSIEHAHEPEPEAHSPQPARGSAQVTSSAESGWMSISHPGTLFEDPSIQEYCEDVSNALILEQEGYVLLAIPVSSTEPFPLMPVFCFGSSGTVDGQECIIFKIRNSVLTLS